MMEWLLILIDLLCDGAGDIHLSCSQALQIVISPSTLIDSLSAGAHEVQNCIVTQ